MSEKVAEYRRLTAVMLAARERGDEKAEDDAMDQLDKVWFSMSAAELDEVDPAGAAGRKRS